MTQKEAIELMKFAGKHYPETIALADVREYYIESTRGEDGVRHGTVTHEIPDVIAQSLRGPADKAKFHLLMISIPRWVEDRSKSGILTPEDSPIVTPWGAGRARGLPGKMLIE